FNRPLQFEPLENRTDAATESDSAVGMLLIPAGRDLSEADKPGFVVDGQQRLAAIRDAKLTSFPIFVVAFVAASVSEQQEQFILVNSTKPLPKGLIYELLPDTQGLLPTFLKKRQLPALLAARLNHDGDSPLRGMVRTPTTPEGVIKDNSL